MSSFPYVYHLEVDVQVFYWIYDLPNWLIALFYCAFFTAFGCGSLLLFRPYVRRYLEPEPSANDLVYYFLSAYVVFYSLMLGCISVSSYSNFSKVEEAIGAEAATLAAIFNDVSMFPEPHREKLQQGVITYTDRLVKKIWKDQRKGIINESLAPVVKEFYGNLLTFEPATRSHDNLQKETLSHLNKLLELRRQRINSVRMSIEPTFYYVVEIGAAITLWLCCLFSVKNERLHMLLVACLAVFIGLVIFLIAAMDNPYRGEFSVKPEAFELLLKTFADSQK